MDPLLLISLLVVLLLIAGFGLVQQAGRSSRRRTGRAHHPRKRRIKRRDHGGHIARHHGHERSSQWQRVRKEHLLREPACAACGHKGRGIQVHHIKPFHLHPQLELDPRNLITLCEGRGRDHHLLLGHLNTWESYNEHIRDDARRFYRKTAAQIRADSNWQKKVMQRP
jgi:5-methylcytosine-specific restriction endonuclease McrA